MHHARYVDKLRIFRSFDFGMIREKVEPVRYNVSRETLPWSEVKQVLEVEAAAAAAAAATLNA